MSAGNQLDANVLGWVKSEIDETLGQARTALEAYVDNQEDESQLRFCLNYLHQVLGTLQMVELYGASMAAEEMEYLTEALLENKVSNRNDAYEVLIRGILQLPDYLEQLMNGQPDMPMVLLPLLNDLRASRGEALLSENALFTPDLNVEAPVAAQEAGDDENKLAHELGLPGEDIAELAKKLRHQYHLGLLGWFRDKDSNSSLKRIADVINKLRHSTDDKVVSRLLWTASGLIESLQLGGLDSNVSIKLLLGQLDRQIKKIIDNGVYLFSEEPPEDLLKNILYYVGTSEANGEVTQQVKEAFKLKEALPNTQQLEQARADLQGPNVALMNTVSSVLMEDLTRVKDSLDVFVRAENPDVNELSSLCDTLSQMSDTLGMLGLGLQRRTVQEQIDILKGIVDSANIDSDALMDVAAAMLSVENSLQEMSTARAANEAADEDSGMTATEQLHSAEQHKLMETVINEVKVDLSKIKEAISDFSRNTMSPELVDGVPGILAQIKGSLSILSLDRAAGLLDQCSGFISSRIIESKTAPAHNELEGLADAISSIEYYLESLAGNWGQPDTILNFAEESLEQLLNTTSAAPEQSAASAAEQHQADEDTVVDLPAPGEIHQEDTAFISLDDESTMVDIEAEPTSDTLPDFAMLDLDEPSTSVSVEAMLSEEDTLTDLSMNNLDNRGLEIDKQEAADYIEAGEITLDGFDDEPVEESATSIEVDLEALDSALEPQQAEINDEQSLDSLQLEVPDTSAVDDFVAAEPAVTIEEPEPAPATVVAQEYEVSDDIDDEIIEIFLEEAEEEYGNIQRLLPQWEANLSDEEALKDMRRSFHTLKGSGRLVGATDVGEFAWAFENMLNRVIDRTIETGPTLFEVLHRARDMLPVLFSLFKTHAKPGQDVLTLMSYADALSKGEEVILEEPEKEPVILEPEISNVNVVQPGTPIDIDPVLLDIYRKEAETHLAALNDYIANWKAGIEQIASYALLRALHTLNGSSRTAGVQSLSEICGAFENYVKEIQDKPFSEQALNTLEQTVAFVGNVISILDVAGAEIPDNTELFNAIIGLGGAATEQQVVTVEDSFSIENEILIDDEALIEDIDSDIADEQPVIQEEEEPADLGPDYDEELLEIFIEEGEEILDECDNTLHQWEKTPDDSELVEALQRQLHTLKGGARMAGISEIGDLGHDIESMLTAVVDGHIAVSKEMQKVLLRAQDRLVSMLAQVKAHKRPTAAKDLIAEVNKILAGPKVEEIEEVEHPSVIIDVAEPTEDNIEIAFPEETEEEFQVEETIDLDEENPFAELDEISMDNVVQLETPQIEIEELPAEAPVVEENLPEVAEAETEIETDTLAETVEVTGLAESDEETQERRKGSRIQHEQIRVRSDLLDNLVNFAGEVSIYRSRMEQQTNTFRFNLQELDDTINRFREQLRQFEIEAEAQIQYRKEDTLAQGYEDFDPLEMDRFTQMQHLSRGMLESLGDLDSLRSILSNITRESETLLVQQSRVTSELQEGLMRTRMVQVSGQAPRLRRIVRQTSDEMGKQVEFHMHGMDNELDRNVLDRVIPPIEHMLRNAIAHGIETPGQRKQAGKNEAGEINISFNREGGEFVIRISDDGAGINLDAIRDKAIEKGIINANTELSKAALLDIMMQSGFSTAEEVTQIAGRGVGMDVVNTEIKQLGGHLQIDTESGKGTLFTINMPLTLAVSRALMVNVGDETYAIPLLSVEGVERVSQEQLMEIAQSDKPVYHWVGNDYKFMHLSSAMGMHQAITYDEQKSVPVLLVRSGDYRAAIQVDRLIGSREIVVKPIGPQFSNLRGVSGATIMGDGSVVLIIDPAILVRLSATEEIQPVAEVAVEEVAHEEIPATVMIVDDSITVRKVTTRFLERNDMNVLTAKDGVDALQQLQIDDNIPDVMLLDVEMPRMDGFELATNVRNDERLKNVPIIMITSRTGAKHRDRAMSIGVNVYLGKPYNEAQLLEHIHELTGK